MAFSPLFGGFRAGTEEILKKLHFVGVIHIIAQLRMELRTEDLAFFPLNGFHNAVIGGGNHLKAICKALDRPLMIAVDLNALFSVNVIEERVLFNIHFIILKVRMINCNIKSF